MAIVPGVHVQDQSGAVRKEVKAGGDETREHACSFPASPVQAWRVGAGWGPGTVALLGQQQPRQQLRLFTASICFQVLPVKGSKNSKTPQEKRRGRAPCSLQLALFFLFCFVVLFLVD